VILVPVVFVWVKRYARTVADQYTLPPVDGRPGALPSQTKNIRRSKK